MRDPTVDGESLPLGPRDCPDVAGRTSQAATPLFWLGATYNMNRMGTPTGHAGQSFPPESLPVGSAVSEHETLLKYEAILNNASVRIAFTKDRAFQHANRAFEELFAWPADVLVGQSGMVVGGSPKEYAEVGNVVGPLLSQGKSVELERRMKRRDGLAFGRYRLGVLAGESGK